MSDDLAVALGAVEGAKVVRFGGCDVTVSPMTLAQIGAVARALKGIEMPADPAAWLGLVADHSSRVAEAVAAATGKTAAEVEAAPGPEFMALFEAVIEVNADFFVQAARKVFAMMLAAMERSGAGSTPSKP